MPAFHSSMHVAAPVAGLNTVDAASDLGPKDAAVLVNMLGAENGLRPRLGSQVWVEALNSAGEVRTMIPYTGAAAGGANDKLFAATQVGIVDCTASGLAGPVQAAALDGGVGTLAAATYFYVITALGTWGESGPSNEVSIATLLNHQNNLSWAAVALATGYRVYRGTAAGVETVFYAPGNVLLMTDSGAASTGGTPPTTQKVVATFGTSDVNSGYGESVVFTTLAGRFGIYADETNGYYVYTEGGAWALVAQGAGGTQINNVNPNLFCWCVSFKNRLWFVERGSTRAWYLPLNSIYGGAVSFDFGRQFPAGGQLATLYVWTLDGGTGADDMLVGVSTAGDVVVYQGQDPNLYWSFSKAIGTNVGGVPAGRRLASAFGGELMVLTSVGVLPISRLVAGRVLLNPDTQSTEKIRNLFNIAMNDRAGLTGWGIFADPLDAALIVTYPKLVGEVRQQFAMSLAQKGWSQYSGKAILCGKAWHRKLYFGTEDGKVMLSTGYMDNVSRDGSTGSASAVKFNGVTAFRDGGNTMVKRAHMIRARMITYGAPPALIAQARFNFDVSDVSVAPASPVLPANVFDTAQFGTALFGGGGTPYNYLVGAIGVGTHLAIAFAGSASQRCNLIGFDIMLEQGNSFL